MAEEVAHSKLGASSYARWKACPGSVRLSQGLPPQASSVYAEEGTKAHEYAATLLGDLTDAEYLKIMDEMDPEMLEHLEVYWKYIDGLRDQNPTFEAVEQRIDLIQYHPLLFGTADHVAYFADTKTLYVTDLKYGAGVAVEVEEDGEPNEQLMYYATGALCKNGFPVSKVVIAIVQPRCFHPQGPIRTIEVTPVKILDFLDELIADAKKTEDPNSEVVTGDHCRWCPAQPVCPARRQKALIAAKEVFAPEGPYDPQKLADTLTLLPQVEAWAKSVRQFAYREAEAGRHIPGFKLVDKRATRRWKEDYTVETLAEALDAAPSDLLTEPELKSVAQVEKLLPKIKKSRLEQFTIKESSGQNLVPITDDRDALKLSAKDVFSDVGN